MELKWEEPPPSRSGPGSNRYQPAMDALRSRPGEWAVVADGVAASTTAYLRKRFAGFEFTQRQNDDGKTFRTYGRFIG